MKEMPEFFGRSLVELQDVPMIGYLSGEFGKAFLEIYNTVIDEKYNGNKRLKAFKLDVGVVQGSSTYSSIISADILRQSGFQLAKPADIEFARELYFKTNGVSGLNTKERYVDYGVVFRSVGEPNEYLAKRLEPQIKKALGVKKIKNPVVIFSEKLELVNDDNAPNGLGFSLRKEARPFATPALKKDMRFSKTDESGMPIPDKEGNRIIYTINTGLSRLYLNRGIDLCSAFLTPVYSTSDGRVVAVKKQSLRRILS